MASRGAFPGASRIVGSTPGKRLTRNNIAVLHGKRPHGGRHCRRGGRGCRCTFHGGEDLGRLPGATWEVLRLV